MSFSRSRRSRNSGADQNENDVEKTYEEIMGRGPATAGGGSSSSGGGSGAKPSNSLSTRLIAFRKWLSQEAKAEVHSAVCIVNGEATDGTRNAPVLVLAPPEEIPPTLAVGGTSAGSNVNNHTAVGRIGNVDGEMDATLYDRTMGCQLRAVREIKEDEVIMTIPRGAMITPDLVASSDAGKAVLACCKAPENSYGTSFGFWDVFENTTVLEKKLGGKVNRSNGTQMLISLLQERKKAEGAYRKYSQDNASSDYQLAEPGTISTRAPLLAFLIHQRFSNSERPLVSGSDFGQIKEANDENALREAKEIQPPPNSPETFAPYARTVPSSIGVPLCWKRVELAHLAGGPPGQSLLQQVASDTVLLAAEFIALLKAGITKRFPHIFPEGLITWERWVWAAAVTMSRLLPATSYIDVGSDESFKPAHPLEFQSPWEVWNELGVMIPLVDMLNSEVESHQVTWQPPVPATTSDNVEDKECKEPHPPRAITHRKIRKGSEIFTCYGLLSNSDLILRYGFALMNNPDETVKMGWSLAEGVGNVKPPQDHVPQYKLSRDFVFESNDEDAIKAWWTEDRIKLLKQEASMDETVFHMLVAGRKMITSAYNDGTYHPVLLVAAVIATMPNESVSKSLDMKEGSKVKISARHQVILRRYLEFVFLRKLEKLLQIVASGIREHYVGLELWTKASEGGLDYEPPVSAEGPADAGKDVYTGWQKFFDTHAYKTAMEVEDHYYAMGSDSCILTFYDCQLRALQASADGISSDGKLSKNLAERLQELGFELADPSDGDEEPPANGEAASNARENNGSRSPRSRRRSKKNKISSAVSSAGNKPPALKLHVGNLSYKTTPSDLYDYFCELYGQENVLECHIPTEKDTGRSRGFGFVAMPEEVALRVLASGKKHEVGGRIVKIAKSNSVGSGGTSRSSEAPPPVASDRCATCGYRPRYCTCDRPNLPAFDPGPYGPPPPGIERDSTRNRSSSRYEYEYDYDRYGPPHDRYDYDRYGRYDPYDRDYRYRYGESVSRSYEGRGDDRHSRRERERSPDRSRSSRDYDYEEGQASRREGRREGSWERDSRKRSSDRLSRSRSRERSRKKKNKRRNRSRSRSPGAV